MDKLKLLKRIPIKSIEIGPVNVSLIEGKLAKVVLLEKLKQVSIVFEFPDGKDAKEFFNQIEGGLT